MSKFNPLDYAPDDPLMAGPWIDCLQFMLAEHFDDFTAATGITYSPPTSPMDRMIDDACGLPEQVLRQFVDWFNADVWGTDKDCGFIAPPVKASDSSPSPLATATRSGVANG